MSRSMAGKSGTLGTGRYIVIETTDGEMAEKRPDD
jgi:hypothetical protein